MTDLDELAAAADRKSSENPELKKAMGKLWASIAVEIRGSSNTLYNEARRCRAARVEFPTAFLEDADPAECTARARKAGGL